MATIADERHTDMIDLKGTKVLVVGLGVSGVAAAKFLKEHGADVRCTDSGTGNKLEKLRSELAESGIPAEVGGHTAEFFIVDQFGDFRVLTADFAVGVLTQLDKIETHIQGVV